MNLEPYFLIKLAHLLLFVYWLGGDIGVFYSAIQMRNPALTPPARQTAMQILVWVDQIPRYCLVLMLPVGYSLAQQVGAVQLSSGFFVLVWVVAAVWLWAVWAIHHYSGTTLGERLRSIDLAWRYVLAAGLMWDAVQAFRGRGHLLTDWLAAKFVVFSLLVVCGILVRVLGRPTVPAMREIFATGSTPELEARIKRTSARTRPVILAIWALLVVAAWFGISKPEF
jgi:hypothetical protein